MRNSLDETEATSWRHGLRLEDKYEDGYTIPTSTVDETCTET
jgi:hypothetical protein